MVIIHTDESLAMGRWKKWRKLAMVSEIFAIRIVQNILIAYKNINSIRFFDNRAASQE